MPDFELPVPEAFFGINKQKLEQLVSLGLGVLRRAEEGPTVLVLPLSADERVGLVRAAAEAGQSPQEWAAACIRAGVGVGSNAGLEAGDE